METMTEETTTGTTYDGSTFDGGDVLDTPALALPPATPDIHEGTIVSVIPVTSEKTGNTYGTITVQSKNTGQTFDMGFFPPQAWFDPANWTGGKFDPATLSDDPPPGKKESPKVRYAKSVASSQAAFTEDGTPITTITGKEAPLQLLRKLAAQDGLTLDSGVTPPTSGEEYINIVNALVAGRLEILFTRKPEKNDDPAFDGRLKVNQIYSKSILTEANFEKRFSGFRKAWEV